MTLFVKQLDTNKTEVKQTEKSPFFMLLSSSAQAVSGFVLLPHLLLLKRFAFVSLDILLVDLATLCRK